jgi:ketosteroid isomerase-like protein
MPSREIVEAFAAEVEAGRYVEAIQNFYAPNASMQENGDAPRVGRDALVAGEQRALARSTITGRRVGPILVDGDQVAIRWRFELTSKDGQTSTLDEIAWQRWEGEKVIEERFFYDPKQLGR